MGNPKLDHFLGELESLTTPQGRYRRTAISSRNYARADPEPLAAAHERALFGHAGEEDELTDLVALYLRMGLWLNHMYDNDKIVVDNTLFEYKLREGMVEIGKAIDP